MLDHMIVLYLVFWGKSVGEWLGSSVSENETHEHGEISTRLFTSAEGRGYSKSMCKEEKTLLIYLFFFAISWAAPAAYGVSQARGLIRDVAASLYHSHSNAGSKPRL